MRHDSWTREEALGTLIDYHIGFANIDQAPYTSDAAGVRYDVFDRVRAAARIATHRTGSASSSGASPPASPRLHDYLYFWAELVEWKPRIEHIQEHAATTFVFANNDVGGKAVVNALQLAEMLGDDRRLAPTDLIAAKLPTEAGRVSFRPAHAGCTVFQLRAEPARSGITGRAVA